jgi:hypothetical protein
MMEAERASETLDCSSIMTRLVAREDFIAFSRRESLKSYMILGFSMLHLMRKETTWKTKA